MASRPMAESGRPVPVRGWLPKASNRLRAPMEEDCGEGYRWIRRLIASPEIASTRASAGARVSPPPSRFPLACSYRNDAPRTGARQGPAGKGRRSEQFPDDGAEDAEGALVFEAFGGLVELLQGDFGVAQKFVVVDESADASVALIHFFHDFFEVGGSVGQV